MSLRTAIIINKPMAVLPVFEHARLLLSGASGGDYERVVYGQNKRLQDFSGWMRGVLTCTYGADGPLIPGPETTNDLAQVSTDLADYRAWQPAGFIELALDTSYGYRCENAGVADIHAGWVAVMGAFCAERGAQWFWRNENDGTWHEGFEGLDEMGTTGEGLAAIAATNPTRVLEAA